ncbi:MAG: dTDP-glucose 4,6-dehydratase [Candidatus Lindowbacteria bacterium RIFCSPLOWO2_12_FULL_62_27]|nr:MAG: dTDP-glucose 4,6-dehydratase [Candidatus Lindowbacteria bacterium RIFCSPLOWO2_02_FULL_62_12]OGH63264.1 MAG: dTDP-glucose 4,6-dehydratase [Candidatus Lindowbacteria bacterium RIFCSPLOWO2_12_FULL_62_27]
MKVLVTGGCGFIGSYVVKLLLAEGVRVVNLDKLTYAGNLANLREVERHPKYRFIRGDVCDPGAVAKAARGVDGIVHLAAETHVDRSILSPGAFVRTDMLGTYVLLEEARKQRLKFFAYVSTDEVYGSIARGKFRETDPTRPTNPYAASKLGADRLAHSYFATYGLKVVITRGSNTYGPRQFPEKLIPLTIIRALQRQPIPVYGDGRQRRDWLHAEDHARAIWRAATRGRAGETYNVSGHGERENIWMVRKILAELHAPDSLIRFVRDREGHDRRYALEDGKLRRDLGFRLSRPDIGRELRRTVRWYVDNRRWWEPVIRRNAAFKEYFKKQYGDRLRRSRS